MGQLWAKVQTTFETADSQTLNFRLEASGSKLPDRSLPTVIINCEGNLPSLGFLDYQSVVKGTHFETGIV